AALSHALPVDVPSLENEGRVSQYARRPDLVNRCIELERGRRHRRVEAFGNRHDAFRGSSGQSLLGCQGRGQPQQCCGCSDCGEASDSG
ncbi:hypothetical protein chiPu_0031022, partial [Chiloscyllium punctatum]|nr:hypothetical protein [Chiloscyllium punctatum]